MVAHDQVAAAAAMGGAAVQQPNAGVPPEIEMEPEALAEQQQAAPAGARSASLLAQAAAAAVAVLQGSAGELPVTRPVPELQADQQQAAATVPIADIAAEQRMDAAEAEVGGGIAAAAGGGVPIGQVGTAATPDDIHKTQLTTTDGAQPDQTVAAGTMEAVSAVAAQDGETTST